MALLFWLFFARLGYGPSTAQDRVGLLQETTALPFVGMLSCIAIFPFERDLYFHEHKSSARHSVLTFLLAYTVQETIVSIISSFVSCPLLEIRHRADCSLAKTALLGHLHLGNEYAIFRSNLCRVLVQFLRPNQFRRIYWVCFSSPLISIRTLLTLQVSTGSCSAPSVRMEVSPSPSYRQVSRS